MWKEWLQVQMWKVLQAGRLMFQKREVNHLLVLWIIYVAHSTVYLTPVHNGKGRMSWWMPEKTPLIICQKNATCAPASPPVHMCGYYSLDSAYDSVSINICFELSRILSPTVFFGALPKQTLHTVLHISSTNKGHNTCPRSAVAIFGGASLKL